MSKLQLKPQYLKNPAVAEAIMRIFRAAVETDERLKTSLYTSLPWYYGATNAVPPPGGKIGGGFTRQEDK